MAWVRTAQCQGQVTTGLAGSNTVESAGNAKGDQGQTNGDQDDDNDQLKKCKAALRCPTLQAHTVRDDA